MSPPATAEAVPPGAAAPPLLPPLLPALRHGPAGKVLALLLLVLVLQVPLWMVSGLVAARSERQDAVLAEFRRGWGPAQVVAGPTLLVPLVGTAPAAGLPGPVVGWTRLQPARLQVTATLHPEVRQRGLFRAVVYTADVALEGGFAPPPLPAAEAGEGTPDWRRARVLLDVGDARGLAADARLTWDGRPVPLDVGEADGCGLAVLEAPLDLSGPPAPDRPIAFSTAVTLQGTVGFGVVPLARQVALRVASPWPTPGFTGGSLPRSQEHGASGFEARWDVAGPGGGRGWQAVHRCDVAADAAALGPEARIGVELQQAVPTGLMVERASKYGTLFVLLAFGTLYLFEVLAAARVHLVQYGLVGLSLSLFALLLVSVAEPLGFAAGYAISAAAVLAQSSLYATSVLRSARLVASFSGMLAALFGLLYVLLSLETFALLFGSLALFALLSAVMLATRRVRWSGQLEAPAGGSSW